MGMEVQGARRHLAAALAAFCPGPATQARGPLTQHHHPAPPQLPPLAQWSPRCWSTL